MTEQDKLREKVARIICADKIDAEIFEAGKLVGAKEERERLLKDLLVLEGWATPEQALKSILDALKEGSE